MTTTDFADKTMRVIGVAIGLGLVVAAIIATRPAEGHGGVLPASLRVVAGQDGAVAVSPATPRPLLLGDAMRPGGHLSGRLRLRNQTGRRLAVGLRAHPSSTGLDGTVHVRLSSGGVTFFDGTLQALRAGSEGSVPLMPGAAATVRATAWVPADTETGYEGIQVSVLLTPVYGAVR
jgi:hypothetical protein